MTGKAILNGIDSIQRVIQVRSHSWLKVIWRSLCFLQYFKDQKKYPEVIDGYYGTLIENFECDKTFFTSVEVTAGSRWVSHEHLFCVFVYVGYVLICLVERLFHHIVDSDRTGTEMLREMNRLRLPGEVTFMPLNRLSVGHTDYPATNVSITLQMTDWTPSAQFCFVSRSVSTSVLIFLCSILLLFSVLLVTFNFQGYITTWWRMKKFPAICWAKWTLEAFPALWPSCRYVTSKSRSLTIRKWCILE